MAQAGSGSNRLVFSSSRGGIIIRSAEDYDSEIHVLIPLMTLLLMYDLVETCWKHKQTDNLNQSRSMLTGIVIGLSSASVSNSDISDFYLIMILISFGLRKSYFFIFTRVKTSPIYLIYNSYHISTTIRSPRG